LDFQLSEHEKFLRDFTELFKGVDRDRNGLIDEGEFRELLSQMRVLSPEREDADLLLLL
jgi:Ca2+-binding EF-hand superfamily protein